MEEDKINARDIIQITLLIVGVIAIMVAFLSIIWLTIAECTYYHWEYMYNARPIDTAAIIAGILGIYIWAASWMALPLLNEKEEK